MRARLRVLRSDIQLAVTPLVVRLFRGDYDGVLSEYEPYLEAIATSGEDETDAADEAIVHFMDRGSQYFRHMDDCLSAAMAAVTGKGLRDPTLMTALYPATIAFTLAKVILRMPGTN